MYAAIPSRQSMDHLKPVASSRTGLATRLKGSPGRETPEERTYFNAVGLAYVDIGIARAMEERARAAGAGSELTLQQQMIFEHPQLAEWVRL